MRIADFYLGILYSGGGERLVLEEMRGLRTLGDEVTRLAPHIDREGCVPDVPEMADIRPLLPWPSWLPMKDALRVTFGGVLIPDLAWLFRSLDIFLGGNQPGQWPASILSRLQRKLGVIYLAQPLRILHPRGVEIRTPAVRG